MVLGLRRMRLAMARRLQPCWCSEASVMRSSGCNCVYRDPSRLPTPSLSETTMDRKFDVL